MGKRGGGKKREHDGSAASSSSMHPPLSIREEASGKKQSHNPKSMMKFKHLQNLAEWATREASVPSLGVFFGRRFAEFGESLGVSPDAALFPCQRCETILQPGFNCTVRIEKNRAKRRPRSNKTSPPMQNCVVYTCHFCSQRNLKRGTAKGYVKDIGHSKSKLSLEPKAGNINLRKCDNLEKSNGDKIQSCEAIETASPSVGNVTNSLADNSSTPLATTSMKLLDSKRRIRKKPGPKGLNDDPLVSSAPAEAEKPSGTSKKRKKTWTSLREIAASEERERNEKLKNFSIPFIL